jgi:hypothetical protein
MTTTTSPNILFDVGHNEELALTIPELTKLVELLEANGMTLSSTYEPLSEEELSQFQVIVLGNPLDALFDSQEIDALVSFVKSGGGLLMVSGATIFGKGGDAARNTNLNQITKKFGFEFAIKALNPPEDAPDELITAVPAGDHPILQGITHVRLTSAVSLIAEDAKTHLVRGANIPGNPTIAVAVENQKGRIIAIGGGAFFFNGHIEVEEHEQFIVQLFRWLSGKSLDQPIKKLASPPLILDEVTASEAIANLQQQLDKIEAELTGLKEVINTSLKDMEKLLQQFQDEKES